MSPASEAKTPEYRGTIKRCLLIVASLGWLAMTVLRETPAFWRNAGGYPVGFRMFVLDFYPFVTAALLLAGARWAWALFRAERHSRLQVGLTLAFLALLTLGLGLMVANNVVNLIEGRPLHSHPNLEGGPLRPKGGRAAATT